MLVGASFRSDARNGSVSFFSKDDMPTTNSGGNCIIGYFVANIRKTAKLWGNEMSMSKINGTLAAQIGYPELRIEN
jgi:hypothetical protein